MIVVFDGMGTSTKVKKEVLSDSFAIVFTPSRMTADSYIEKESYIRRNEYRSIYVVTSDGPEQSQVLGNGSYRVAVDDLMWSLKHDKKDQHTFIKKNNQTNRRSEIGHSLPPSVQENLINSEAKIDGSASGYDHAPCETIHCILTGIIVLVLTRMQE